MSLTTLTAPLAFTAGSVPVPLVLGGGTTPATVPNAATLDRVLTAATRLATTPSDRHHQRTHSGKHPHPHPHPHEISPVTLSSDWSRVVRLLLLASLAVIGSVGNIFMVSAVMIEDHLKKRGNTFIANVALADLLITGLVIPASTVAILAGLDGSLAVCRFQWFLAVLCFLVTLITLAATAAENYIRLCAERAHEFLSPAAITALVLVCWFACSVISGLQFVVDIRFDYCTKTVAALLPHQAAVVALLVFVPLLITLACYARTIHRVRAAHARPSFKPPVAFQWDYALAKTNLYSFLLFVLFWLPFGIVLAADSVHDVSPNVFYNLAWVALSKSVVNSLLYCACNRHFRHAYVSLFHYCCCKTTVTLGSRRTRGDVQRPSGDVRVHIIPGYNMYSYTSPQRPAGPKRHSGHPRPTTHHSRDVYEL